MRTHITTDGDLTVVIQQDGSIGQEHIYHMNLVCENGSTSGQTDGSYDELIEAMHEQWCEEFRYESETSEESRGTPDNELFDYYVHSKMVRVFTVE